MEFPNLTRIVPADLENGRIVDTLNQWADYLEQLGQGGINFDDNFNSLRLTKKLRIGTPITLDVGVIDSTVFRVELVSIIPNPASRDIEFRGASIDFESDPVASTITMTPRVDEILWRGPGDPPVMCDLMADITFQILGVN